MNSDELKFNYSETQLRKNKEIGLKVLFCNTKQPS